MSQFDSNKDYYGVLGVDKDASQIEIDRQYKREASKHHPDRGGSEERMKSLNEAYGVLKDESLRSSYDEGRRVRRPPTPQGFAPVTTPTARNVGVLGHCLSALLCLIGGVFLLLLVRFQWFWFLWPLVILAVFVILFGVLMAHSAMVAANASLAMDNPVRRYRSAQEAMFWAAVAAAGYGVYLLLTSVG